MSAVRVIERLRAVVKLGSMYRCGCKDWRSEETRGLMICEIGRSSPISGRIGSRRQTETNYSREMFRTSPSSTGLTVVGSWYRYDG